MLVVSVQVRKSYLDVTAQACEEVPTENRVWFAYATFKERNPETGALEDASRRLIGMAALKSRLIH